MIGRITGILAAKQPPEVLVDVNGIGYELQLPMSCFFELPETGQQVSLVTHFVVREDAQLLYGFITTQERSLFRALIKVNGIGPKVALAILSSMSAGEFVAAVEQDDLTALTRCPGVGKKTAERLLVEMKDRIKGLMSTPVATKQTALPVDGATSPDSCAVDEAVAALEALGYKSAQALKMVKSVAGENDSCETLIRMALRSMAS